MKTWLLRNSTYAYIGLVVISISSLVAAASQGTTITVVAGNDIINGNVSSLSTLINDPGTDGISLSEAVMVANSDPEVQAICFDPALKGAVIAITNGIPPITGGQLTISGDMDSDGIADITLDGGGSADTGFYVHASDVTIEGFFITNFRWMGINIGTKREVRVIERVTLKKNKITVRWSAISVNNIWEQNCVIRDVEITENTLVDNGFIGINIQPGSSSPSTNNLISDIRITENTISNDGYKLAVFACGAVAEGSTSNVISNLLIARNTISGHRNSTLLITGGNASGTQDNGVDSISIVENTIEGSPVTIEIVGGVGASSNWNTVSGVEIAGNMLRGGGIQIVGADGHNADQESPTSENNILDISIRGNTISDCAANGILIQAGTYYSMGNIVEDVLVSSNLIYKCKDAGINLLGGWRESPDNAYEEDLGNILDNVHISNNTITENGNDVWAGGIVINSNVHCSGNSVTNVEVDNTILWNNKQNDRICDIEESKVVRFSILGDSRYIGKNGNFYDSPRFMAPEDMNYQLQWTSPAIDMGNPNTGDIGETDCGGNTRIIDGNMDGNPVIDIGAYEFAPSLLVGDVNMDGQVNIADLLMVGSHFGESPPTDPLVDLNNDDEVNILDLIIVAKHFGEGVAAAPSAKALDVNASQLLKLQKMRLEIVDGTPSLNPDAELVFALIDQLIALSVKRSMLHQNYPNPFNPETWIPYQLSGDTDVKIMIHSSSGHFIRTLDMGHKPAGSYVTRESSAYWDGRNETGEQVASGVYFYSMEAGDYSSTKKMTVLR